MTARDFRLCWRLPESARNLPRDCVELSPGQTLVVKVEGGFETASEVMNIANDHIGPGKVIMVWQNIDPPSDEITFKCVGT